MKTTLSRNQVFRFLGTVPTNPRWSWCALSADHTRAVFTLWEDLVEGALSPLEWRDYNTKHSNGAKDQQRTLELVVRESVPAFGLACIAHDTEARPRSIKKVETDYLVKLKIERIGGLF